MYVRVVQVGKSLFEGEARSLSVPGSEGDMTILSHHTALISALRPGAVVVTTDTDSHRFDIKKGLIEISNNEVIVLL